MCELAESCPPRRTRTQLQGDVRWASTLLAEGTPESVLQARRVLAVHESELAGLCHACAVARLPAHLKEVGT